jgi:hypothetical protein
VIVAVAEVAELLHQIQKGEQREKAEQDEKHCGIDLAREIALEGIHPLHRTTLSS